LEWATKPNPREKASSFPKIFYQCKKADNLNFIKDLQGFLRKSELGFYLFADGHTDDDPHIKYKDKKTIVFCADLLQLDTFLFPMLWDTRPLTTMPEKTKFLNAAADNNYYLFLEHDAHMKL
jgi:hypothetical protein